jgi:hypothetical protein
LLREQKSESSEHEAHRAELNEAEALRKSAARGHAADVIDSKDRYRKDHCFRGAAGAARSNEGRPNLILPHRAPGWYEAP